MFTHSLIIKVPVPLTDKKIGLSHFSLADQNSISEHSILQWGLQLAILGIASRPFGKDQSVVSVLISLISDTACTAGPEY